MDPVRQNPIWLTCKPLQRMCNNRMLHITTIRSSLLMFPPDQHHWLEVATEDEGWNRGPASISTIKSDNQSRHPPGLYSRIYGTYKYLSAEMHTTSSIPKHNITIVYLQLALCVAYNTHKLHRSSTFNTFTSQHNKIGLIHNTWSIIIWQYTARWCPVLTATR